MTETGYFRIFTLLAAEDQLLPWFEPPPAPLYSLNVDDEELRVDIGQAKSLYQHDIFKIELAY